MVPPDDAEYMADSLFSITWYYPTDIRLIYLKDVVFFSFNTGRCLSKLITIYFIYKYLPIINLLLWAYDTVDFA